MELLAKQQLQPMEMDHPSLDHHPFQDPDINKDQVQEQVEHQTLLDTNHISANTPNNDQNK
jgi:hypothetical protein